MALCDCYGSRMDAAKKWTPQAKTYDDFRKLLADKTVDAVIIATQDQWHAQMLILACEAGKDVYLEKPVVYRVGEAKAMIDAVRRNKRIVQVGTQHRAADHMAEAARIVQGGKIGEVHFVRVWNYMGTAASAARPSPTAHRRADLNWDAWLGPAPKVPFNRNRLGYRSFMDYTNGIISDYGNHRFDSVHQIMGEEIPLTVASSARSVQQAACGRHLRHAAGHLRVPELHPQLRGVQLQRARRGRQDAGHALLRHAAAPMTVRTAWLSTAPKRRCSWTASAWSCIRNRRVGRPEARAGAGAIRAPLLWPLPPGPPAVPRGCT